MIKGLFRLEADRKIIAELNGASQFRFYVDKLRYAHAKAVEELMHCHPRDLQDRRSYARCLGEIIAETTKTGDIK
jgi:hypothetical protein